MLTKSDLDLMTSLGCEHPHCSCRTNPTPLQAEGKMLMFHSNCDVDYAVRVLYDSEAGCLVILCRKCTGPLVCVKVAE